MFNALGNLTQRHTQLSNHKELFTYDSLNRLTEVKHSSNGGSSYTISQTLRYNAAGDMLCKSGINGTSGSACNGSTTTHEYLASQNHAASKVGTVTYQYDLNGNNTSSSDGRSITYTSFDKASRIEKGNTATDFIYGIDRGRIQRVDQQTVAPPRSHCIWVMWCWWVIMMKPHCYTEQTENKGDKNGGFMIRRIVFWCGLVLCNIGVLSGCATSTPRQADFTVALERHLASIQARDIDEFTATITRKENLYVIFPNGTPLTTRTAVLDFHREWFADQQWQFEPEIIEVFTGSDMSTVLLKYAYRDKPGTESRESWLVLVFQLEDGEWRLIHDQNTRISSESD